jgi:hypothetical protein
MEYYCTLALYPICQLVCVHARFLSQAEYYLKTNLGICSKEHFQHCETSPIYRNGQGSTNSGCSFPASCLMSLNSKAHGATFWSPCKEFKIQVCVIGFVVTIIAVSTILVTPSRFTTTSIKWPQTMLNSV